MAATTSNEYVYKRQLAATPALATEIEQGTAAPTYTNTGDTSVTASTVSYTHLVLRRCVLRLIGEPGRSLFRQIDTCGGFAFR